MKILKSAITIILTIIIASSCAAIAGASVKAITESILITQYTEKRISINAAQDCEYSAKALGRVTVTTENNGVRGGKATFLITANKTTGTLPSMVTITENNYVTGATKTVRTYKVMVKAPTQTKFKTIRLSKGSNLVGALKNLGYTEKYTLKIKNSKIVKQVKSRSRLYSETHQMMTFDTYKKGSTTAGVYVKDTKVGTVTIEVGNYKPYIDLTNNTLILKYNPHGRAEDLYDETITDQLRNYDASRHDKLTFRTDSNYIRYSQRALYPFTTKRTGKTSITILDRNKPITTINVNIVKGTMAEVYKNNLGGETDADFLNYDDFIHVSYGEDTFDLADKIHTVVLNNDRKRTSCSKDNYTITGKSPDASVATIDNNGIIHAGFKAYTTPSINIRYTIKFTDGSAYTGTFYLGFD